jgi:Ras GTPase-activating-like protein IQGAP2/3
LLRGALQRRKFRQKMQYFRNNLDKVVKIQSLFRAKEQREQYRQLTMGKNVNVGTIKNFVHLLDDSEADFEDEIRVEWMRKQVVEGIRENQSLETEVNELDTKIALVVQNVKTFEELIKARRLGTDSSAAHSTRASVLAAHGDPFAATNALDQQTMRRLELYQQLFYLLQTQGGYLARLFFSLSRSKVPEKNKRTVERVVLTLFGYGQESREDYLLLKLFQVSDSKYLRKPALTITLFRCQSWKRLRLPAPSRK